MESITFSWTTLWNIIGSFILSCVTLEIVPIKINPIGWLAKKVIKEANAERDKTINDRFDKLEAQIKEVDDASKARDEKAELNDIEQRRARIIRFAEEIGHKVLHTKEHFDNILDDIDQYENYCDTHPNYPNTKAVCSVKLIKTTYDETIKNNSFR